MQKYRLLGVVLSIVGCLGHMHAMDESAAAVTVFGVAVDDLNAIDADGDTQLHKATHNRDVGKVRRLLGLGANPNLLDAKGNSPFFYAVRTKKQGENLIGQCALVQVLYCAGGDDLTLTSDVIPNIPSHVLEAIYEAGVADSVSQACSQEFCALRDAENPLSYFLMFPGFIGIVKEHVGVSEGVRHHPLRQRMIAVADSDSDSDSDEREERMHCFMEDCAKDKIVDVRKALYLGVDINSICEGECGCGDVALCAAARGGKKQMVQFLLDNRANVNIQDKWGRAPLHFAVGYEKEEVVRLLLDNRANTNVPKFDNGWTPLHMAVADGYHEIVWLLLGAGASIAVRDKVGRTPLALARNYIPIKRWE